MSYQIYYGIHYGSEIINNNNKKQS
jgi:hypothetical protein